MDDVTMTRVSMPRPPVDPHITAAALQRFHCQQACWPGIHYTSWASRRGEMLPLRGNGASSDSSTHYSANSDSATIAAYAQ